MRKRLLIACLVPQLLWAGTPQIIISGANGSLSNAAARFESVSGQGGGAVQTTDTPLVQMAVPSAGTWSKMRVVLSAAPSGGASYAITFRTNAVDSLMTCTVSGSNTTCQDVSNSSATVVGDMASVKIVPSGSPTVAKLRVSFQFLPTTANQYVMMQAGQISNGGDVFGGLSGVGAYNTTETKEETVLSPAGTLKNFYARADVAPGVGTSETFTVRKNNVDTLMTCAVVDNAVSCTDTSNSVSVVAGDILSVRGTPSGVTNTASWGTSIVLVPTTAGEFPLNWNIQAAPSTAADTFFDAQAVNGGGTTTDETIVQDASQSPSPGVTLKNLYTSLTTAPGVATSYAFTLRKNAASSSVTCTVSGTATTCNDLSNTYAVSDDDLLTYLLHPSVVAPASSTGMRAGLTGFIAQPATGGAGALSLTGVGG